MAIDAMEQHTELAARLTDAEEDFAIMEPTDVEGLSDVASRLQSIVNDLNTFINRQQESQAIQEGKANGKTV